MKKNPGKYNYASMGAGSISHLAMEALASRSGTSVVHVPYAGSGPAVTALLAGNADIAVLPAAAVMPQIKAGKIKALAVATAKRSARAARAADARRERPEGHPGRRLDGLRRPGEDARCDRAAACTTSWSQILAEPEVREKLKLQYMDVSQTRRPKRAPVLAADIERWRPIIQKNNITLD